MPPIATMHPAADIGSVRVTFSVLRGAGIIDMIEEMIIVIIEETGAMTDEIIDMIADMTGVITEITDMIVMIDMIHMTDTIDMIDTTDMTGVMAAPLLLPAPAGIIIPTSRVHRELSIEIAVKDATEDSDTEKN